MLNSYTNTSGRIKTSQRCLVKIYQPFYVYNIYCMYLLATVEGFPSVVHWTTNIQIKEVLDSLRIRIIVVFTCV